MPGSISRSRCRHGAATPGSAAISSSGRTRVRMVNTTARLWGRRRRVCRSTRSQSCWPAFSAVRPASGSRGCGWNSVGLSTTDQLARQTGRSGREVGEEPVGRRAQPLVEARHRRVDLASGRPSFSPSRQWAGKHERAAVSA